VVAIFGAAAVALGKIERNEKLQPNARSAEWTTTAPDKGAGLSMAA
jgi:hypothetical protein